MLDVFKEYAEAELNLMQNQTDEAFNIFERLRRKALKVFNKASSINGGKEIRIPLYYGEDK